MVTSRIIHLAGSTNREGLVKALCQALPGAEVLAAIDGRTLTPGERAVACVPRRYLPPYPFALLPAEIGVFLSHRRCWKEIAKGAEPFGIIAEDDLTLDPQIFPRALALSLAHAGPDCLIRFPLKRREVPLREVARDGEIRLFRPRQVALSATLQIVGRDLAARLLDLTAPFDRPVDTFLQMAWLTRAEVMTVWPSGCATAATGVGGSTIQRKLPMAHQLWRTLARARYRAAIRRLAACHRKARGA